jgi:predicted ester cyclase
VEGTVVDPPHVASFETIRAIHASDFFGYPGTNKPIEVALARLVTAEDGLITHQRTVFDFTGLLVQVGVLRATPGKLS